MKKAIMALAVVGLLMAGCKKQEKETLSEQDQPSSDSLKNDKSFDLQPSTPKKYLDWLTIHPDWVKAHPQWQTQYAGASADMANPCDPRVYDLSVSRHEVGDPQDFDDYARAHSRNPSGSPINYYDTYQGQTLTVASVLELMHDEFLIECYDGWLEVKIDNQTPAQIVMNRSDNYDYKRQLFSEPLFRGIEANLHNLSVDPANARIEFTHIKTPTRYRRAAFNLNKIGFKLSYTTPDGNSHTEYYDMSDDPL